MDFKQEKNILSTEETANMLGVSVDTLRRWDKAGTFIPDARTQGGHRKYTLSQIDEYLSNIISKGKAWAKNGGVVSSEYLCERSNIFQARLDRESKELFARAEYAEIAPMIMAVAGEIGDNSFAHNIGNWPDTPGVFLGFDAMRNIIVLADRGRGVQKTLQRVRPELTNDHDALFVAFTEVVSGRAPEARGNGLKFVRKATQKYPIGVFFQSGNAETTLEPGREEFTISKSSERIPGCFAIINF